MWVEKMIKERMRVKQQAFSYRLATILSIISVVFLLANDAQVYAGDVKHSGNKADSNLKSSARVNPSTLAMEFSLPFASYPGRAGNTLPVGINYSSKVWDMQAGASWFTNSPCGAQINITHINPIYSDKSLAGWTSSLRPPMIVEKLELYDESGEPLSTVLSEPRLNELYTSNPDSPPDSLAFCKFKCAYGLNGDGSCAAGWQISCTTVGCNPGEICSAGGGWVPCGGGSGGGSGGSNPPPDGYYIKRVHVQMPDGSRHEFRKDDSPHLFQNAEDKTGSFLAVDGSQMRLERGVSYEGQTRDILYLPNGGRYIFSNVNSGFLRDGISRPAEKYIDINGNQAIYDVAARAWTDTLGRPPLADVLPTSVDLNTQGTYTKEVALPGMGNGTLNYKVKWSKLELVFDPDLPAEERTLSYKGRQTCAGSASNPLSPNLFNKSDTNTRICAAVGSSPPLFNPPVLSEVELPNGSKYVFKYNRFGEITRIEYPTGAYERFEYGEIIPFGTETSITYDQANRGVKKRLVYQDNQLVQTWSYKAEIKSTNYVVATTAPDGTVTERYLYRSGNSAFGFDEPRSGMAFAEYIFKDSQSQLAGEPLRWSHIEWASLPPRGSGVGRRDPHVKSVTNYIFEGGNDGLKQTTAYEYDADLNVKRVVEYPFEVVGRTAARALPDPDPTPCVDCFPTPTPTPTPSPTPTASPVRVTETTYLVNDSNIPESKRNAYRKMQLLGLPTETKLLNPNDFNIALNKSQIVYDEATYLDGSQSTIGWQNPSLNELVQQCSTQTGENCALIRANPTTEKIWDNENQTWIMSHTQFDNFGNVRKVWDTSGDQDRFVETEYDAQHKYAYPTKTITQAPDSTGAHGTAESSAVSTAYDFQTGKVVSVTVRWSSYFRQKTVF